MKKNVRFLITLFLCILCMQNTFSKTAIGFTDPVNPTPTKNKAEINTANTSPTFISTPPTGIVNLGNTYTYTIQTANAVSLTSTDLPSWLTLSTRGVSTLAGNGSQGFADGTGTAAQLSFPTGVAVDSSGTIYVADLSNHRIRKITPSGVVSTFAGSSTAGSADGTGTAAQFAGPYDVVVDSSGNVYVADTGNHLIRKITPGGVVTTLAGGDAGFAEGTGTAAQFNNPTGVAVDSSGTIYVADQSNHLIRKITPGGVVSTLAGSGSRGFTDGAGTAAQFNVPTGVAVDSSGNVYVADLSNHRIRKITPGGVVSTFAGSGSRGSVDGTGTAAQFNGPNGVAVDSSGTIYVADRNNHRIRKITPSGVVTTLAGSSLGFADGTATTAKFDGPTGVAVDSSGTIYVADQNNHRIRKITENDVITGDTTGQEGTHTFTITITSADGSTATQEVTINVVDPIKEVIEDIAGNANEVDVTASQLNAINGVSGAIDGVDYTTALIAAKNAMPSGFADPAAPTAAEIQAVVDAANEAAALAEVVEDIAGNANEVDVTASQLNAINGVSGAIEGVDYTTALIAAKNAMPSGFADPAAPTAAEIQAAVDAANEAAALAEVIEDIAGNANEVDVTASQLNAINGVSGAIEGVDYTTALIAAKNAMPSGFADPANPTTAEIQAVVDAINSPSPTFISTPPTDIVNLGSTYTYTIQTANAVSLTSADLPSWLTLSNSLVSTLAGSTRGFVDDTGTAAKFKDPTGVAVDNSGNVYVADLSNNRIRKITPGGVVTTFAGSSEGFADGPDTAAKFFSPYGVAVDSSGNVYVADSNNNRIRKITPSGVVTTLAGGDQGFTDGTGTAAQFNIPYGVAVDSSGNVYVADQGNHRIRKITPGGVVTTLAGSGSSGFVNGTGTTAQFNEPYSVAVGSSGNVYVADQNNHSIRKITSSGVVTTLAGSSNSGSADGTGTAAQFSFPHGVAVDSSGTIYVADRDNHLIRKITPGGVVTTLAGSGLGFADGTGTAAKFGLPFSVAVDSSDNVFVADLNNNRIRKIAQGYVITGDTTGQEGTHTFTITITSTDGSTATQEVTINVVDPIKEVIEDIAGNANEVDVTASQLNAINGVSGAIDGVDYTTALIAAKNAMPSGFADPAAPTAVEIQAVVDAANSDLNTFIGTSGGWISSSNWSAGTTPSASSNARIPKGKSVTINTGISAITKNLIIEETGSLSLDPSAQLEVTGNLTHNGSITLTSNATHQATLIVQGTLAGDGIINYDKYLDTNWNVIASPVNEVAIAPFFTLVETNGTKRAIGTYVPGNAANTRWVYEDTGNTPGNYSMGKGYAIRKKINDGVGSLRFSGKLNVVSTSSAIQKVGDNNNGIGNPFTAYVDAATFLNSTGTNLTQKTIWVWDGVEESYITKNLTAGYRVAPGEGFFVNANANASLTFDKSNQEHAFPISQRSAGPSSFELVLNNDTKSRQSEVYFIENMTTGFDNGYDSSIFSGVSHPFVIYTELVTDNEGKKLGIQSLPNSGYHDFVIPVGVHATANEQIVFDVNMNNLPSDLNVVLEDRETGVFTDLAKTNYTITPSSDLAGIGRFYIHTNESSSLSVTDFDASQLSVYQPVPSTMRIVGLEKGVSSVKVFTLLGREIVSTSFESNGVQDIDLPKVASGVYLVEIQSNSGRTHKKIVLE